jgi:hypothetical protein
MFTLVGSDGEPCRSPEPGRLGGNKRSKTYGRLDCKAAARYLARGTYQKNRVFFADEATAIAAGYRACRTCMPRAR